MLFDLDGTLLDIDLDSFLSEYFTALGPVVGEALGTNDSSAGLRAVLDATTAMSEPHPGLTNRATFNQTFTRLTGVDLDLDEYALAFERFYRDVFPTLRHEMGPLPGARRAIQTCLDLGLKVAIATNPIFPRSAIDERMRWADVANLGVHAVTSYENMHATKPHAAYFEEVASMLGVAPRTCLMVGDDRALDMSAANLGMRTFYVGGGVAPAVDWSGTLDDLADLIPRLLAEDF